MDRISLNLLSMYHCIKLMPLSFLFILFLAYVLKYSPPFLVLTGFIVMTLQDKDFFFNLRITALCILSEWGESVKEKT